MPELITLNYKRYYTNSLFSFASLFTLIMLLLIIFLPALIVIYSKGKKKNKKLKNNFLIFRLLERYFFLL